MLRNFIPRASTILSHHQHTPASPSKAHANTVRRFAAAAAEETASDDFFAQLAAEVEQEELKVLKNTANDNEEMDQLNSNTDEEGNNQQLESKSDETSNFMTEKNQHKQQHAPTPPDHGAVRRLHELSSAATAFAETSQFQHHQNKQQQQQQSQDADEVSATAHHQHHHANASHHNNNNTHEADMLDSFFKNIAQNEPRAPLPKPKKNKLNNNKKKRAQQQQVQHSTWEMDQEVVEHPVVVEIKSADNTAVPERERERESSEPEAKTMMETEEKEPDVVVAHHQADETVQMKQHEEEPMIFEEESAASPNAEETEEDHKKEMKQQTVDESPPVAQQHQEDDFFFMEEPEKAGDIDERPTTAATNIIDRTSHHPHHQSVTAADSPSSSSVLQHQHDLNEKETILDQLQESLQVLMQQQQQQLDATLSARKQFSSSTSNNERRRRTAVSAVTPKKKTSARRTNSTKRATSNSRRKTASNKNNNNNNASRNRNHQLSMMTKKQIEAQVAKQARAAIKQTTKSFSKRLATADSLIKSLRRDRVDFLSTQRKAKTVVRNLDKRVDILESRMKKQATLLSQINEAIKRNRLLQVMQMSRKTNKVTAELLNDRLLPTPKFIDFMAKKIGDRHHVHELLGQSTMNTAAIVEEKVQHHQKKQHQHQQQQQQQTSIKTDQPQIIIGDAEEHNPEKLQLCDHEKLIEHGIVGHGAISKNALMTEEEDTTNSSRSVDHDQVALEAVEIVESTEKSAVDDRFDEFFDMMSLSSSNPVVDAVLPEQEKVEQELEMNDMSSSAVVEAVREEIEKKNKTEDEKLYTIQVEVPEVAVPIMQKRTDVTAALPMKKKKTPILRGKLQDDEEATFSLSDLVFKPTMSPSEN